MPSLVVDELQLATGMEDNRGDEPNQYKLV